MPPFARQLAQNLHSCRERATGRPVSTHDRANLRDFNPDMLPARTVSLCTFRSEHGRLDRSELRSFILRCSFGHAQLCAYVRRLRAGGDLLQGLDDAPR
jgi:hypothetical protein